MHNFEVGLSAKALAYQPLPSPGGQYVETAIPKGKTHGRVEATGSFEAWLVASAHGKSRRRQHEKAKVGVKMLEPSHVGASDERQYV